MSPGFGSWCSWSPRWTICFHPVLEFQHQVPESSGHDFAIFFFILSLLCFLDVHRADVLDGCNFDPVPNVGAQQIHCVRRVIAMTCFSPCLR